MIETIKLLFAVIFGLIEALPQTNADGKIPDADYDTLIGNAVLGVVKGGGFQVAGYTDAQITGVSSAFSGVVRSYKSAVRVAV